MGGEGRPRPPIALVYDATTPAGAAAATHLAAHGAWVAIGLRANLEHAHALRDAIRSDGGRALMSAGDPANPREAWTMAQRLELEWGEPDIVVLIPPGDDDPARVLDALANLLDEEIARLGPGEQGRRFVVALANNGLTDQFQERARAAPAYACVVAVVGGQGAESTGMHLAELALAEACAHGAVVRR